MSAAFRFTVAVVLLGAMATPAAAQSGGQFNLNCSAPGGGDPWIYHVDLDQRLWCQSALEDDGVTARPCRSNSYFASDLHGSHRTAAQRTAMPGYIQGDWLLFENYVSADASRISKIGANLRTLAYVDEETPPPRNGPATQIGHCVRQPFTGLAPTQ